jgi:predicted PurR-regulated permease PerM
MAEPLLQNEGTMEDGREGRRSSAASPLRVQYDVAPAAIFKVGGALLTAWLVVQVWSVLVLVLVSLMLVATLNPVVRRLQTRFSRPWAITLLTVAVLLLVVALPALTIPPLVRPWAEDRSAPVCWYRRGSRAACRHPASAHDCNGRLDAAHRRAGAGTGQSVHQRHEWRRRGGHGGTADCLSVDRRTPDRDRNDAPAAARPETARAPDATQVGAYTRGQLVASGLAGLFAFLLLWLLHVPQPLALAFLMAVANAIPVIGPLLGTVPAVLAALTMSVPTALAVAAGYLLFYQFESQFLIPRMYSKSMKMSASAVLIAISMGTTLMGILGAILALPVAAAVRVVFRFVREWQERAA